MQNIVSNDTVVNYFIWAYRTSNSFLFYANLTIVPFGLFFNLLSYLVFSRKTFEKGTMGFYFRVIAIMDSIALTNLFAQFFTQSLGIDLVLVSSFTCIFFNLFLRVSFQASAWLNVIVTLDRLACIKYVHKQFKFNKNKKILLAILFTVLLAIILTNIPVFFLKRSVIIYNNQSLALCNTDRTSYFIREFFYMMVRTVLPFVIMLYANITLIRTLRESRLKFKKTRSMQREYYFASSLIIINSIFLANLLPLELSKILFSATSAQLSYFTGVITIIYFVTTYISAFNHVFPFFINLKFNKIFYNEVCNCIAEVKEFLGFSKVGVAGRNRIVSFEEGITQNGSSLVFTIQKSKLSNNVY
ncbi:FMRFamide receptor-like [Brachionus plicatilis]|uniref:FMRFamide receptor-like n=1 Tax=Brachionus plicatilis TaxID=10195 RepID=A0A3M7QAH9_BRAPC|nr:FMRFamide receptor-like [Brachionus plicatilis]